MEYILAPKELMHSREWKSHKYIKKVMSKGKWLYYYGKNKARGGHVTNQTVGRKGRQYSPTVKTKSYYGTIGDPHDTLFGYGTVLSKGNKILTEPMSNFFDPAKGQTYNKPIESLISDKKRQVLYMNARQRLLGNKREGINYTPPQSSKAASSRHYTPK